ncbi:DUF58 domain-containing protein [Myxococcota bacterium]|nr:DUF58 domain-containing protein [Myxococcota bacterium]
MRWFRSRSTGAAAPAAPPPPPRRPRVERKDVASRARGIHVRASHEVTELLSGQYVSVFKGRGMEFEEVREYVPGDDVRAIDWNVTARMGHPFVKEFREERELTVVLMVDVSPSQQFGTDGRFKSDVAAEIAATLAFAAVRNNDNVGLILFSDRVERYVPPRKTRGHVWRVISEILSHHPEGRGTDIGGALGYLSRVVRRKAVVFLLTDFLDAEFERSLRVARQRHDITVIPIVDPREREFPDVGFVELEDPETGEWDLVDTGDARFRDTFRSKAAAREQDLATLLQRSGVDPIPVSTEEGYDFRRALLKYFRARGRRAR